MKKLRKYMTDKGYSEQFTNDIIEASKALASKLEKEMAVKKI